MSSSGRLVLLLIALSLPVIHSSSRAATADRTLIPVQSEAFPVSPAKPALNCTGQTGVSQAFAWFFPSDDYYYTFLDPAECCFSGVTYIKIHWTLFWPQTCSINVQVFVIRAIESPLGSGCYVPDHAAAPPDPEPSAVFSSSGVFAISGTGLTDHIAPGDFFSYFVFPGEKAFVVFKIVSNIDCPVSGGALESPAIVVDSTPDPCISYNGFLGGPPIEMTSGFGFPGNTSMWFEMVGCFTPTLPTTWGQMKVHYR